MDTGTPGLARPDASSPGPMERRPHGAPASSPACAAPSVRWAVWCSPRGRGDGPWAGEDTGAPYVRGPVRAPAPWSAGVLAGLAGPVAEVTQAGRNGAVQPGIPVPAGRATGRRARADWGIPGRWARGLLPHHCRRPDPGRPADRCGALTPNRREPRGSTPGERARNAVREWARSAVRAFRFLVELQRVAHAEPAPHLGRSVLDVGRVVAVELIGEVVAGERQDV